MRWLRFRKSESTNVTDLKDGQSCEMSGLGVKPYVLKNTGGVYSCSCPAWRNQSIAIEKRSCKHLRKLRGDQAEQDRVGKALPRQAPRQGRRCPYHPKVKLEAARPKLSTSPEHYDPANFCSCTKTAFISCNCFVSTSLFVTIGALCVGWPLNRM